jgi:tripartite-type tricarboxylate transporter receptor subunit TctC
MPAALAALGASAPPRAVAQGSALPRRRCASLCPSRLEEAPISSRALGQALKAAWKQPTITDNKAGAGGAIGAEGAARATPGGHARLTGHVGTMAVNPTLYPKLRYPRRIDFAPVALLATVPDVPVVKTALPARDVREPIALAKAKPGALTYGSGGAGRAANLAMECFKAQAGTELTHIPYKGTGPAITDATGGQMSMTMIGLPPLHGQIRRGMTRMPLADDLPA